MATLFSKQDYPTHPIFERFNALFGDIIMLRWPLVAKFEILVMTVEEFKSDTRGLPPVKKIVDQPFFCSSDQDEARVETTHAGIIFNPVLIEQYGFSEEEQFASIAHEIGHIILRFREKDGYYTAPQSIEVFADSVACEIGLASPMLSTIIKLENSGRFPNTLSLFGMRKLVIETQFLL